MWGFTTPPVQWWEVSQPLLFCDLIFFFQIQIFFTDSDFFLDSQPYSGNLRRDSSQIYSSQTRNICEWKKYSYNFYPLLGKSRNIKICISVLFVFVSTVLKHLFSSLAHFWELFNSFWFIFWMKKQKMHIIWYNLHYFANVFTEVQLNKFFLNSR